MKPYDTVAYFFLVVSIALFMIVLYRAWCGAQSLQWPTTFGEVTKSVILVTTKGTMRSPDVRYEYTIAGCRYEGRNISALGPGLDWENSAQKTLDRYPVGARVSVFFDPNKPHRSVLEPGISKWELLDRIARVCLLIAIGLGFLFWA